MQTISKPVKIKAIRTNLPGYRHFNIEHPNVGEINFHIKIPGPFHEGVMYSISRPEMGKNATLWVCAENVTGLIFADGTQVLAKAL